MIKHREFAKIRLHQFMDRGEITELRNWRYWEHKWIGEGYGFSNVLQLTQDPERTRAILLDIAYLPEDTVTKILRALDLDLALGMQKDKLELRFGAPIDVRKFTRDRSTFEYCVTKPARYEIHCTVLNEAGLIFVAVIGRLPLSERERWERRRRARE